MFNQRQMVGLAAQRLNSPGNLYFYREPFKLAGLGKAARDGRLRINDIHAQNILIVSAAHTHADKTILAAHEVLQMPLGFQNGCHSTHTSQQKTNLPVA